MILFAAQPPPDCSAQYLCFQYEPASSKRYDPVTEFAIRDEAVAACLSARDWNGRLWDDRWVSVRLEILCDHGSPTKIIIHRRQI